MNGNHPARFRRSLYAVLAGIFRIFAITFLATLLAFSISLFLGIVGVVLTKMIRGTGTMDMSLAYRHVALPIAFVVMVIAFCTALFSEIRRFRQGRAREGRSQPRSRAA